MAKRSFEEKARAAKPKAEGLFVSVGDLSVGVTFGAPGARRSFAAISMACSVATGSDWFGRNVEKTAVVCIPGEGHNGLARRFRAWQLETGIPLANAPFVLSRRGLPIFEAAHQLPQALKVVKQRFGRAPGLIVIDTLARNFGGDENSTGDMSKFGSAVDALREGWHGLPSRRIRAALGATARTCALPTPSTVSRRTGTGWSCWKARR